MRFSRQKQNCTPPRTAQHKLQSRKRLPPGPRESARSGPGDSAFAARSCAACASASRQSARFVLVSRLAALCQPREFLDLSSFRAALADNGPENLLESALGASFTGNAGTQFLDRALRHPPSPVNNSDVAAQALDNFQHV